VTGTSTQEERPGGDIASEGRDDGSRRSDFWIQIRNSALQYIGVGWFLTQVFAVMGSQFGWPTWVSNWVIIILGVGFVLAMVGSFVVAWQDRVSRTPYRRRHLAIAAIAAVAALALWLPRRPRLDEAAGSTGLFSQGAGPFSATMSANGFFVVHPQEPLVPTGVRVTAGQSLSIWGEGQINVALASLVEAARSGDEFAYEWVGPAGEVDARGLPILRRDRARPGREQCLLHREAPYGALLAMITPSDRVVPGTVRDLEMDAEVFVVGTHLETTAQANGYLILGVNDVYLDEAVCDPEAVAAGREPGVFYRDNIGFFTARVLVD
jgi:hypothetical protein